MRVQRSSLTLLTRYRTKFRGFLGEAYTERANCRAKAGARGRPHESRAGVEGRYTALEAYQQGCSQATAPHTYSGPRVAMPLAMPTPDLRCHLSSVHLLHS